MGQVQSVSSSSFQEEYYLFFDEKSDETHSDSSAKRYEHSYSAPLSKTAASASISGDGSDFRLVRRSHGSDVFNMSTHSGAPPYGDLYSIGNTASLDEDLDGSVIPVLSVDDCQGEFDCTLSEYRSPSGRRISGHYNGEEFTDGRIVWPDGREYEGALKGSVPHGFGTYRTSTGKEYKGDWHLGLQHGTGCYVTEKDGRRISRRGIWETGQLVRWLDEDEGSGASVRHSLLNKIMATPTTTPELSPSSRELSPVSQSAKSPIVKARVFNGACSGEDPGVNL
ncbi:MORN motif containing protein, putative [Babesia ovata]|uniref:MORN motif containing protein, putative n=1 Tax=Babesia ovata TaxID=189622 RepID=A0A2H6KCK4_9APIC|nr:MORN motif containing protein, putative [Babesia ovata]GBE60721.1 MORN motif containing protein, putative [Babesia ovata]